MSAQAAAVTGKIAKVISSLTSSSSIKSHNRLLSSIGRAPD
ncbi:hypothetical protein AA0111_g2467 [Alternaria arborescens]|nr:hypothetical protein AA0111_g2467 [Alternaria arborescens]RYO37709.1 hypothetical protein AA0111_g2467 [Alternaria arborescens]